MKLHPRHRIDIAPSDLAWGLAACAERTDPDRQAEALARQIDAAGEVIPALSVRSGFDLLLAALALPAGSEVLLSVLTIPDMARLVRAHGLVPVPVEVDLGTLSPTRESLERAWSPRARVLVVAQLMGGRADLDASARFAAERGLLFVDDSAQAYTGPRSLRESTADVVFHSFGSIKTATCLGGALVRVRSTSLRDAMRSMHARWPAQPDAQYARKLSLYAALVVPRHPSVYAAFAALCDRFGEGLNPTIMGLTRGFPSEDLDGLLRALRRRPCGALCAMMARRIERFDPSRVARRTAAGEALLDALGPEIDVLGRTQRDRTHWLVAVLVNDPERCIAPLRAAGFDSARGATSMVALPPPPERPDAVCAAPERAMQRILFLPAYPEIPHEDHETLARTLRGAVEPSTLRAP